MLFFLGSVATLVCLRQIPCVCVIHGLARYSFFCFRSKRVDRCVGVEHEEYLEAVDLTYSTWGPYPPGLPLTSLCDLPLLFVYFQVNNSVLYFLDYYEDIYIMALSVLVSM